MKNSIQTNQKSLPLRNNTNGLFQKLLKSSNPQDFLNSLISNNPQMKSVIDLYHSSGMTPKDFFYHYAQQNGIDPDNFIDSIKSGKE